MRRRGRSTYTPAPLLPQLGPDCPPPRRRPHRGASAAGVWQPAGSRLTWGCGRTVRSRLLAARVKFGAARGPSQPLRCVGSPGASRARAGARRPGHPASPARKAGGGPRPTQGSPQVAACKRAALPAEREAAGERSPKNLPPGKLRGRTRRRPAARVTRAERKGREGKVPALTGHGDGSGSNLPPLRPLVRADVAGPAPFARRHQVVFFLPPLHARAPALIGQRETRGVRCHAPVPEGEEPSFAGGAPGTGRGFPGALGPAWRN